MYHPESDSLFEMDASELPGLMNSLEGQLCNDVTGDPICEDRFRSEQTCQSVIIPHTPGHQKA